jgi:hypothetical protein
VRVNDCGSAETCGARLVIIACRPNPEGKGRSPPRLYKTKLNYKLTDSNRRHIHLSWRILVLDCTHGNIESTMLCIGAFVAFLHSHAKASLAQNEDS